MFNNQTADYVHDWLLGIYKDDLGMIILYLLQDMEIPLEDINGAIQNFDYGFRDKLYKIQTISEAQSTSGTIPGYGREILNTVYYLPFILATFLEFDNPTFQFNLLMVDILDKLLEPSVTVDYANLLENLISEHHELVMNLFDEQLKPKNHITTHYGRMALKCGPLKKLGTFHFERKHQVVKSYLNTDKNRINTTYSISKKIGYEDARLFYNRKNIFKNITSHGKRFIHEPIYLNHIHANINLPNIKVVRKVDYKGTEYRIDDFVFSNDRIIAYKVMEIILSVENDSALLFIQKFNLNYIEELRSYRIGESLQDFDLFNIIFPTN